MYIYVYGIYRCRRVYIYILYLYLYLFIHLYIYIYTVSCTAQNPPTVLISKAEVGQASFLGRWVSGLKHLVPVNFKVGGLLEWIQHAGDFYFCPKSPLLAGSTLKVLPAAKIGWIFPGGWGNASPPLPPPLPPASHALKKIGRGARGAHNNGTAAWFDLLP
jgi:hypothetical protein